MTFKSTKTSQKCILLQTNCTRASCLGGPRFNLTLSSVQLFLNLKSTLIKHTNKCWCSLHGDFI